MNYKKYSLEQLENWMHDAMSAGEASPQEIYDTILKVVRENYYTYKKQLSKADELLALLNGNGKGHTEAYDAVMREREYYEPSMPPWGHSDMEYLSNHSEDKIIFCDKDNQSKKCQDAWNDFWSNEDYQSTAYENFNQFGVLKGGNSDDVITFDKPKKDKVVKWQLPVDMDGPSGECYVTFPDDLLEAANLKEGDTIKWIDRGDGSFELRKVSESLEMNEC